MTRFFMCRAAWHGFAKAIRGHASEEDSTREPSLYRIARAIYTACNPLARGNRLLAKQLGSLVSDKPSSHRYQPKLHTAVGIPTRVRSHRVKVVSESTYPDNAQPVETDR